jgi:hypothetical protein
MTICVPSGAHNLRMPPYLPSKSSGVTIPARLKMLGAMHFNVSAVLGAVNVGTAVVVLLSVKNSR